jgi:alkylation response protein AidB-like acyl-CoA dehydrogenase
MLDLTLTPDQLKLQARARAFAETVVRPVSRHYDTTGEWPEPIFRQAWEQGFLQASVSKDLGGPGHSQMDEVVVNEEISWGCAGMYTAISANTLATAPLHLAGSSEQKRRWMTRLLDAPRLAAFALSEPEAGSDAGAVACTAILKGGVYLLNGTKCFVTGGAYADYFTVFVKTDPAKGARGLSALIVPRDTPGLRIGKAMDKLGHRASNQVTLHFENAEVPAGNRLGAEGSGFALAMRTLDRTRAVVAAGGVGLARAAYELALEHAKTRVQFGEPIFNQQAVSFQLADMATKIEASRLLTWQAAWMTDQGLKNSKQSAMAKTFATDTAMDVATNAVQILGGLGYSRECLAEKFFRDAKLMQIYEGTNQIQRLVIAKEIQQGR